MRIGLLGAASSIHIVRIANALVQQGEEVTVISLPNHADKDNIINCETIYLSISGSKGYYLNAKELKNIVKQRKLDVLNAHYASGYGTLGRLSGVHPLIISVWGSDVFSFPKKNLINKWTLKKNFMAADLIYSTSQCMADEIEKYQPSSHKEIMVTPFGVDTELFFPDTIDNNKHDAFVFGFLKGSNPIYGVDLFLEAFEEVYEWAQNNHKIVSAQICGASSEADNMKEIIDKLASSECINYEGFLSHKEMPQFIKKCDIICITSREESFGVVAVETMACGVPCITSDAPGLAEVMIDNQTGYVVKKDPSLIAEKMISLIEDDELRRKFAIQGRMHVIKKYDFKLNIELFKEGYCNIVPK